jgi:Dos2-interacting transcription regulator of RNA-Pol-II
MSEGTVRPTIQDDSTAELFYTWKERCLNASHDPASIGSITSGAEMRVEAVDFFTTLSSQASNNNLESTMAALIHSLKPCFDSRKSLATVYFALSCLVGSVQGCVENTASSQTISILSISLVKLLSTFFLSFAAPFDPKSNLDTDVDLIDKDILNVYDIEEIRDLAIRGLISLLTVKCTTSPSQSIASNENTTYLKVHETANELIQMHLSLACRGVNSRCVLELTTACVDNATNLDDHGLEYTNPPPIVEAGLSMLPRVRRSICFNLLQVAVDSTKSLKWALISQNVIKSATRDSIFDFIAFVTKCLRGESDPRCLLQLLQLINSSLGTFHPLLNSNRENNYSNNILIISNVFAAVSPYYPIQFNPPPNDVHGITRTALRESIVRVLSCSLYDIPPHEDCLDNMSSLTCRLILDCLYPPEDDESISFKEQIELLEDLQIFLFVPFGEGNTGTNLEKLDLKHLEIISEGLLNVFEKASFGDFAKGKDVTLGGVIKTDASAKNLADLCRTLVGEIANKTEHMASADKWHVFVENPARKLSAQLATSVGRVPIAYLACLASCGGFRTLNLCLDSGIPPLLKYLRDLKYSTDTDFVTMSSLGLGAFFSSCRVAIEKAISEGVYWQPHPLERFCNESLDIILEYLLPPKHSSNPMLWTTDVQVAAMRALESILLVFPLHMVTANQTMQLLDLFRLLSPTLLNAVNFSLEEPAVLTAHSQALGTFLGLSLHFELEISKDHLVLQTNIFQLETLRKFFLDEFLPSLLTSARCEIASSTKYVLLALDTAASYSMHASSCLIRQITASLHSILLLGDCELAESLGGILGFLLERKNHFSIQAFQNLSSPDITSLDILAALAPESHGQSKNAEAFLGMSALQLPTSIDDRHEIYLKLEMSYGIVKHLRKGYEVALSKDHLSKLVVWVDLVLPPLCDIDTIMLSLILPLLSAALECASDSVDLLWEQAPTMIRDLTDFAISMEYHPVARSHAARCIHSIIARFTRHIESECPVRCLITNQMIPSLRSILISADKTNCKTRGKMFSLMLFQDNLNLFALLASAAACRGGKSFISADDIVYFLIDIACQKPDVRIGDLDEHVLDFTESFLSHGSADAGRISVIAASAFGSILNTNCTVNILWKQRLIYLSLKRIIGVYACSAEDHNVTNQASIGLLCVLSHLICWSSLTNVSAAHLASIFGIMTTSLSLKTLQSSESSTVHLFLAAIVKLICMVPSSIRSLNPLIVGAIRAFASVDGTPDGILCKLLALQVLSLVAHISESNVKALETVKAVRPAVLSLLMTAANHPSAAVRSAAMEVRNTWYVVEA